MGEYRSLILYQDNNLHQQDNNLNKNIMLKQYIDTFEPLLKGLSSAKQLEYNTVVQDDNIVLAGVNALKSHGLKMSREATDLDVVVFQPTEKQKTFIKSIEFFEIKNPHIQWLKNYDNEYFAQRVYKFKKDGLFLDIIISNDKVPDDLLYFLHNGLFYKIQNIALNVEAKLSYSNKFNSDSGLKDDYARLKDVKDLIDLKNSNFNF